MDGEEAEDPRIAAIAARLDLLESERAILDTLYRYGHAIDYGLEEEWVDCFLDDGVFDVRSPWPERIPMRSSGIGTAHELGVRYQGRVALSHLVARHTRAPDRYHKHCLVEPRISIDQDGASVTSYWVRIDDVADAPSLYGFGRYLDRLERCMDGRWRFRERVVEIESM